MIWVIASFLAGVTTRALLTVALTSETPGHYTRLALRRGIETCESLVQRTQSG
jgi:hypothetical protein